MKILVTGTAGFVGFYLAKYLLNRGDEVIGIDSINDYYDVNLKYSRLENSGIAKSEIEWHKEVQSLKYHKYKFIRMNLEDSDALEVLFEKYKFEVVVNLAAQAGVRYSIDNPRAYINSNIVGFLNILENCRSQKTGHLVYASSSSVYGLNKKTPFSTNDSVDHPVSLYAATKKSNELMAHTYSHLFGIPTTGLRFFTVYGPWGRPDMAYFLFAKAILNGESIKVFNHGNMQRDFTYIDDIIEGIVRSIDNPPVSDPNYNAEVAESSGSSAPYTIYNLGNNQPAKLLDFIEVIEKKLGIEAIKEILPMQPGDVEITFADIDRTVNNLKYKPSTTIDEGIGNFVDWFKDYYKDGEQK
ncbi:NAD-dependent epimerase [Mucilaginibacter gynuensis]|uniref:NAD-dependent epimerase n=1 Tax=Mucilaginibacter gynuensis TaxID=1302236 RepID=A0ABP8GXD0_9SPHI